MPGAVYVGRLPPPTDRVTWPDVPGAVRLNVANGSTQRLAGVPLGRLAPAALGPVLLPGPEGDSLVFNLENLWRGTAVGRGDASGPVPPDWRRAEAGNLQPRLAWYERRKEFWRAARTRRAPPRFYTWWEGAPYGEFEARCRAFAPIYAEVVQRAAGYETLRKFVQAGTSVLLLDYDGPPEPVPARDALAGGTPPGGAAVLACLLAGAYPWHDRFPVPRTWRMTRMPARINAPPKAETPPRKRGRAGGEPPAKKK